MWIHPYRHYTKLPHTAFNFKGLHSPTPTTSSLFRGTQVGDGVLSVGRTFLAFCVLNP